MIPAFGRLPMTVARALGSENTLSGRVDRHLNGFSYIEKARGDLLSVFGCPLDCFPSGWLFNLLFC